MITIERASRPRAASELWRDAGEAEATRIMWPILAMKGKC